MTSGARRLHSVALNLEAVQYLAGWRPEAGTLFLPALSEGRVQDEVAVRVGIFGQPIRATLFGTISLVRCVGRPSLPPGIELAVDRVSLPAAHFLALAARGERVSFRERAPRYVIARPFLVTRDGDEREATTINLSEGGCAVTWTGSLPMVGEVLSLRVAEGLFPCSARAVVCWNSVGGPLDRCVGFRILAEGRAARAWKSVAAEAARSGARPV
jgi:PilZ domain